MLNTWFKAQKMRWLDKRIPASNHYQFDVNNTFILPSMFGWSVIAIAVCLFILGTNYQNNIILLVCYFLIALLLLSLFQSYFYFTRFSLQFKGSNEYYAGSNVGLPTEITFNHNQVFGKLQYHYNKKDMGSIDILKNITPCEINIGLFERGIHSLERLTFKTSYPFGLFTCWTHLRLPFEIKVYPHPIKVDTPVNKRTQHHDKDEGQKLISSSSEELQGIREYRQTDPIHHVSWKHVAKGQGLLSKDFAEHITAKTWLKMPTSTFENVENELGKLTYLVNKLSSQSQTFGLELSNQQIIPNSGDAHRIQCLDALASYHPISNTQKQDTSC